MKKYRKKPVIVEVIKWTGDNYDEIRAFIGRNTLCSSMSVVIPTLEGDMVAQEGDYIIKGIQGECYPCNPDIFEQTYEEVDDE